MKTFEEWKEENLSLAKELMVSGNKDFMAMGMSMVEILSDDETAMKYYLKEEGEKNES